MGTALVSKTFLYGEKPVRTIQGQDGKPWYCLIDVCSILQYKNHRDAINKHCKRDGVAKRDVIDNLGRNQETAFISEPNLCRLVCRSKLPAAVKFEVWVFETLIPCALNSIREMKSTSTPVDNVDFNNHQFSVPIQEYIELLKFKCATLEMNIQKLQQPLRKNFTDIEINTVIEMKSQGFKNHDIAQRLDRSPDSIQTLLYRLKQKRSQPSVD